MKKMLAKAIALSVIVGGMSFVASDAQAAVRVDTDIHGWMNTKPGRYELVEKRDINGIEQKADAAKNAADNAQKTADVANQNASEAKAKADANEQAIKKNQTDTTKKLMPLQLKLINKEFLI